MTTQMLTELTVVLEGTGTTWEEDPVTLQQQTHRVGSGNPKLLQTAANFAP